MDTDRFDWIKDIPAWGTFLGTISISFLAMFSNRLKNWFCRPKLSCEIDNTRKFCEIIDDDSDVDKVDSGISQSDFVWCLKVSNKGKQVADNCRVQCDRIYEENDGGGSFTLKREFISQGFYWSTGDKKEDVVKGKHHGVAYLFFQKCQNKEKNLHEIINQRLRSLLCICTLAWREV
ncbi:MAG: hypothetical protein IKK82_11965 [Kiritimatiellae bacterium]|nr:hypothetical protein [Kiritimatiellia bacterium]